jgi:hypothetical protein
MTKFCKFCYHGYHIPKYCPNFQKYKTQTTTKSEIFTYIKKNDLRGFCSAGVLLHTIYQNKIYILLIKELREDKYGYNFVGGKREYRRETPLKCALREMREELVRAPEKVYNRDMKICVGLKYLWYAPGKYFLIPVEIKIESLSIDDDFKWIEVCSVLKETLHPFAREIIKTFRLNFPVDLYR